LSGHAPWPEPIAVLREQIETAGKLLDGLEVFGRLRAEDIDVGATPKEEVYRDGKVRLFHYLPTVAQPLRIPVLIVYALFNRYYMLDLQQDRSLVRKMLDQGLDLYLIDWGYPDRSDRWLTFDDYVNGYLEDCVEAVRERHELEEINLLGVCQGGDAALCYAALEPEKVRNLITMVTPVDFHVDGSLVNTWIQGANAATAAEALGLIPGELISLGFLIRSPFQRHLRKYLDLVDMLDDEEKLLGFLRMEKWIFDTPDVPGEFYREWIEDFYQGNKLVKGEIELGGRRVILEAIRMPVLNVYAEADDLIPPASSMALERYVGTTDYTERAFPVGHIGMYVSGKTQRDLAPALAAWLKERT
jgi:polyhydroxyalkanoate synthase